LDLIISSDSKITEPSAIFVKKTNVQRADSFHERIAEELNSQFRLESFDPFFDFLEPSSRVKSQNTFYDF
jgi:hypothetical protein